MNMLNFLWSQIACKFTTIPKKVIQQLGFEVRFWNPNADTPKQVTIRAKKDPLPGPRLWGLTTKDTGFQSQGLSKVILIIK